MKSQVKQIQRVMSTILNAQLEEMAERYFVGVDQGGPNGDKTVQVVYDRMKGEIVSIKVTEPSVKEGAHG